MECWTIDDIRDLWMISVISPIKDGDNERSRLSGIGSSGELVFKDVIRERVQSHVCEA